MSWIYILGAVAALVLVVALRRAAKRAQIRRMRQAHQAARQDAAAAQLEAAAAGGAAAAAGEAAAAAGEATDAARAKAELEQDRISSSDDEDLADLIDEAF